VRNEPQDVYARWLEIGSRTAFAFALVFLVLYLTGLVAPYIPLADLPRLWTLPAAELARQANAPAGWGWLSLLRYGDYLNLLAIAAFSLLSLACVARIVPAFLKSGERLQAVLAALQALVLLAAVLHLYPGAR
jgi:hypothetical protein